MPLKQALALNVSFLTGEAILMALNKSGLLKFSVPSPSHGFWHSESIPGTHPRHIPHLPYYFSEGKIFHNSYTIVIFVFPF